MPEAITHQSSLNGLASQINKYDLIGPDRKIVGWTEEFAVKPYAVDELGIKALTRISPNHKPQDFLVVDKGLAVVADGVTGADENGVCMSRNAGMSALDPNTLKGLIDELKEGRFGPYDHVRLAELNPGYIAAVIASKTIAAEIKALRDQPEIEREHIVQMIQNAHDAIMRFVRTNREALETALSNMEESRAAFGAMLAGVFVHGEELIRFGIGDCAVLDDPPMDLETLEKTYSVYPHVSSHHIGGPIHLGRILQYMYSPEKIYFYKQSLGDAPKRLLLTTDGITQPRADDVTVVHVDTKKFAAAAKK